MGLRLFIVFVLLFNAVLSSAQNDSILKNDNIISFPNKITTRISLINTSNNFYFSGGDNGDNLKLEANAREYLGASIHFRSIEIDFGFAPNFLNSNKDNEHSKLFNLNFRMFFYQWMQTIDVYSQQGFYITQGKEKISFPGVKTFKIGGSTSYIFNKDFSFRTIGFQNEWQTKSAGSFIPTFNYYYTKYSINQDSLNENAYTYNMAIAPSYYYNLSLTRHLLISLGGSVGIGINHSSNLGDGDITSVLYEFSGRSHIGYNSNSLFAGISSSILTLDHKIDNNRRQNDDIPFVEFYLGYRFNAPKKWVKFADNFNDKYGF